jgi:D-beta-D-heptose 7-phosphate kinase/D-beta-D-heptose 1-phosphate adenosyltransferase
MKAAIYSSVQELRDHVTSRSENLVVTSGGFDPMHVGHLRCLIESSEIAHRIDENVKLAVIVNGDGFLLRKKGYAFMPEPERLEIIAGVKGVDYVVPWDDGGQTVTGALEILSPLAFTKGGDRDAAANVPEFDLCERIGCNVIFGVGGGKIQSSSDLVRAIKDAKNRKDNTSS